MPVNVAPDIPDPSHDISIQDDVDKWGLNLQGGLRGLREIPQTPSSLLANLSGRRFGDFEPGFSHIQQADWSGGRGEKYFLDDETKFSDSKEAWSLTSGELLPAPQWSFASGLRDADENLPGDVSWLPVHSSLGSPATGLAWPFTASASYTTGSVSVWLRTRGFPASFTLQILNDSTGTPGSVRASATSIAKQQVDISKVFKTTISTALTSGTQYWVAISTISTVEVLWEIAVDSTGSDGYVENNSASWASSSALGTAYYHITDVDNERKFHFFQLEGAQYVVDEQEDGTASQVWMNGERGKATGGTSSTLADTDDGLDGTWAADQWNGYRIKIHAGTGAGQNRSISDTAADGTITVTPDWSITPDTTSQYVIYGGRAWQEIGTTGITGVCRSVAVGKDVVYFPQGASINIRRMRWNDGAATPAHEFADDSTNKADLLLGYFSHQTAKIYRTQDADSTCGRADQKTWGTDLTFTNDIEVGDKTSRITNLIDYDDKLWALKEDSIWYRVSDKFHRVNVGLEAIPDSDNGIAAASVNLFLYFNWAFSLERYFEKTLDDIGPWRGEGLPQGRQGYISALAPAYGWLFAAIDGRGNDTSSVLIYDDAGYHEIFRGWDHDTTPIRIRNVLFQGVQDGSPKLWISVDGDLVYMDYPRYTLNPTREASFSVQHEAAVVGSTMDMGFASIPKYFKEISVRSKNLGDSSHVVVDYQTDADLGLEASGTSETDSTKWTNAGTIYKSPEDTASVNVGGSRGLRYRLRIRTSDADNIPIVEAVTVKGFARTPVKYQWNLRVDAATIELDGSGGVDDSADGFLTWAKRAASEAERIVVRSRWPHVDDLYVIIEPPTTLRSAINKLTKWWSGTVQLTLREA